MLAAAYQQRVLWAEAHADSKLPANHSNEGGVFGPSNKSEPPSYGECPTFSWPGMPFSPLAIPDMLACIDIDRQENVSAYLGLLVNSLQAN